MSWRDRISELPDSLLTQILSYLTTKESVKTSVLSTKWKNLWLNVPVLEMNCNDQMCFDFIDRFLEFDPESCLEKFSVDYSESENLTIDGQIGRAIDRGIKHLDIASIIFNRYDDGEITYKYFESMPDNLYTSNTLISLKLSTLNLEYTEFVSIPCLKFMHLEEIRWDDFMDVEKFLSGCPVLEELKFCCVDDYEVTCVKSQSLKKLFVWCGADITSYTLEIDAPRLEYMNLDEYQYGTCTYVIENVLGSLFEIDLNIQFPAEIFEISDLDDFSEGNEILDFFMGISSVRHMIISPRTLEFFEHYSKVGPIPKFNNLSRLTVVFPCNLLQFLPVLLESCPNVKHIVLKFVYPRLMGAFKHAIVPHCLSSTLEFVEINGFSVWEEKERKVVNYFLENSAVLKKLILTLNGYPQQDQHSDIFKELSKMACSQRCQIILRSE